MFNGMQSFFLSARSTYVTPVLLAALVAISGALFFIPNSAAAQSTAGVTLQPSLLEETVEPGEVIEETFTITNTGDAPQTFYFLKRDISGVGDNGAPIFAEEGAPPTGYELSSWVSVPEEPLQLAPKASGEMRVRITVPENASPGSHFGGVFVSVEAPRLRQTGAAVGYDVGAIISLRIAGDAIESARMREFSTEKYIYSKPDVKFTARVENPGNVLIRPRGIVEVYNMFGKRVALLTLNDSLSGVFPGTTRPFETTWTEDGLGFGRYQVIAGMNYGETGRQQSITGTLSFWILPAQILLPLFGGLAFIILVSYIGVRLYIRRAVEEISAGGARRRIVSRRNRGSGISQLAVIAVTLLVATALFLIVLLVLFA